MFKVECPGCKAPYQVDERRVPSTGLKMRCPKCGFSFMVEPPDDPRRTGPSPVLGVGSAPAAPAAGKPAPRAHKATMLGVAAPGAAPRPAAPPRPGPPVPPRPAPPRPPASAQSPAAPSAELPSDPYGELDLPTVGQARGEERGGAPPRPGPAAVEPPTGGPASAFAATARWTPAEVDLPSPVAPGATTAQASWGAGEIELPSVSTPARGRSPDASSGYGEIELPSVIAEPRARSGALDLPSPAQGRRAGGTAELDLSELPTVGGARERLSPALGNDLPSPVLGSAIDLPSPAIDLPSPSAELPARAIDLPSPAADLPALGGDLPVPAAGLPALGGGLPVPAAGLPALGGGLPVPAAGLPALGGGLPIAAADLIGELPRMRAPSFGELEIPGGFGDSAEVQAGAEIDPFASSLPPPRRSPIPPPDSGPSAPPPPPAAMPEELVRQAGGGTSYGEVNLDGGGADSAVGVADDDMEFGAIPQESEGAPPGAASAAATGLPAAAPFATVPVARVAQRKQSGRGLRIGLGLLVLVAVGGGALSMVPSAGPYGAYFIADRLNAGRNAQMVSDTVAKVRTLRGLDTSASADEALALVERQRGEAKRVKALAAYAAFLGYEREIRFGGQPAVAGRAKVLLDELAQQKPSEVRYLALARAAQSAYAGQLARARQELEALAASDPRDVDVRVLDGEVGLRAQEPKAALSAWQAAQSLVDDARTRFGLARAELALGDATSAAKDAEAALAKSPKHIGARILLARAAWLARGDEAGATKLLSEATAPGSEASADEQVAAKTLLGTINLARSRFTQAEAAFTDALKIDPKAAGALAGLGESLYRSGRFSEALARYEAAVQADPEAIEAKLGVAKAKIALERLDDAKELLKKLREDYPKSTGVSYWYGEALEALGQRKEAEDAYRAAIEMGGTNVSVVEPYVALALLLGQQGRSDEAKAVLDEARKKLPDLPQIHKAVGELALSQGRYDEALAQYRAALALDPTDVGAKFRLGVALRRDRQFDAATKVFDEVAGVDRDYPGLALERGLLFEASGRSDEALKSYEAALAKAPSDPDLMLRVGCGKVAAGRAKEAEELLRKVLQQRPNSAETNHCLGRALLVEGTNLAEALRSLERATDLDPNRAEYWLYVGWAANDAGRVQRAETALKKALELDQGLADAYWQRGVLRFRQGSTKEAIADLLKALELRPSRYEAHATLADAYYDMGQEGKAMDEWQQAIAAQGDNATWRFRYGKLLAVNRRAAEAEEQLTKAVELGDAQEVKPDWLPEAHLQLARVMGAKKEAIRHWEAFLRDGPRDSPYRAEAKAALVKLGRPWTEN